MNRRGFTLVELALSALVLGVAVLALLTLARLGVRAGSESEEEVRAAMFADDVFTTLGVCADYWWRHANPSAGVTWVAYWEAVRSGATTPVPAWRNWQLAAPDGELKIYGDGIERTNVYRSVDTRGLGSCEPIPEYALRYRLSVVLPPFAAGDPPVGWTNVVRVTLHVWPGAYGALREPLTFYTHFADPGGMP